MKRATGTYRIADKIDLSVPRYCQQVGIMPMISSGFIGGIYLATKAQVCCTAMNGKMYEQACKESGNSKAGSGNHRTVVGELPVDTKELETGFLERSPIG